MSNVTVKSNASATESHDFRVSVSGDFPSNTPDFARSLASSLPNRQRAGSLHLPNSNRVSVLLNTQSEGTGSSLQRSKAKKMEDLLKRSKSVGALNVDPNAKRESKLNHKMPSISKPPRPKRKRSVKSKFAFLQR